MTEVFKRHVPYADFSPVDRYIAVEELKKELLTAIEPLVDSLSNITIDVNNDNQIIINGVAISDDFRYCSDFSSKVYREYLLFNDNGIGTFVDFGMKILYEPDQVYAVFRISKKDKRIMNVLYRCPERKGCPLVSPLAKPHEYKEVMQIIERGGITE
ncbi:MAG: hypothetical protein K2M82_02900 [Lachnospiraceae bacterium]|nr:hypothetical protein [Lachnospiraceae bacterium]